LMEEVTAHAQSDSLEDAREICAEVIYFLNNRRTSTTFHSAHWPVSSSVFEPATDQ
jgi:hypothetical protein